MTDIDERVTRLEDKVSEMDKTISIFGEVIKRFDKAIDKLDITLEKIKEDQNFSVTRWLRDNFVGLILGIGVVLYLLGLLPV